MNAASAVLAELLTDLQPHLLGDYFVAGQHHNETFDLLAFLVNGAWTSRPVVAGPLYRSLPCARLIQSHVSRGLALCSGPGSDAHPFPEGVWGEPLCCGTASR